jgi:hypothetical protein
MASAILFSTLAALINSSLAGIQPGPGVPPPIADTIRLQIVLYPGRDADANCVKRAKKIASELLKSAGIHVAWREDILAANDSEQTRGIVPVLMLPHRKASKREVSGEVAQNADADTPTLIVYVAQVAELVGTVRASRTGRVNPFLLSVGVGDVVGLTIAHEVGHILGLPHAAYGIMKAEPEVGELVQLRASRLSFAPSEVAQMRRAMMARAGGIPEAR